MLAKRRRTEDRAGRARSVRPVPDSRTPTRSPVQPQSKVTQDGTGPAPGTRPEGAGLPRRIHAPRAIGVVLGALCVGAALIQHGTPTWTWLVVAMQVLVWPHLAYWLSSRSPTPREAEYRN